MKTNLESRETNTKCANKQNRESPQDESLGFNPTGTQQRDNFIFTNTNFPSAYCVNSDDTVKERVMGDLEDVQ